MKTWIQSLSFLATLAIVIGMISWGGTLNAQTTSSSSTPQDQQAPPPQQSSPDTQQQPPANQPDQGAPDSAAKPADSDGQVFSGTVVKSGDKYMFKDDSGKIYDIDHQDEVKQFDGKRVRVHGKLDETGKKILVK